MCREGGRSKSAYRAAWRRGSVEAGWPGIPGLLAAAKQIRDGRHEVGLDGQAMAVAVAASARAQALLQRAFVTVPHLGLPVEKSCWPFSLHCTYSHPRGTGRSICFASLEEESGCVQLSPVLLFMSVCLQEGCPRALVLPHNSGLVPIEGGQLWNKRGDGPIWGDCSA